MMNKGLEIIEAKWLFDLPTEKIDVIIHPQSIVHSMVEFVDGSVKAQLGMPDMKLPIQYALNYPERVNLKWEKTSFAEIGHLTFEYPDFKKFPAIKLAYDALKRGGTAPAILNVVNELAVYAFLENKIRFTDITQFIGESLSSIKIVDTLSLSDILESEKLGRKFVESKVKK
jgi:1-deoxy-D-xylulose-5-phosphate reductoisomerase